MHKLQSPEITKQPTDHVINVMITNFVYFRRKIGVFFNANGMIKFLITWQYFEQKTPIFLPSFFAKILIKSDPGQKFFLSFFQRGPDMPSPADFLTTLETSKTRVKTYFPRTSLHYIALHYTTLHYITLHYITLHYITLHYITLHYITLHYITLHYITLFIVNLRHSGNFERSAQTLWWRLPDFLL
jgi:hypothetical protein